MEGNTLMYHDFWGRIRFRKDVFLHRYMLEFRGAEAELEDLKKEALSVWNFIQENK